MNAWEILLEDKYYDTVWFADDMNSDEVYETLICHDNYDPSITVAILEN